MKSILVIYDDLCELDRTEVAYKDEKELKTVIRSLVADYPEAELVEVYTKSSGNLALSYTINQRGMPVEKERTRPRRGGYRPGCEKNLPHPPAVYRRNITIPMTPEMKTALDVLDTNRAEYIRKAIEEKFERDGKPLPKPKEQSPKQPEGYPDRRYHLIFRKLPPSIKTYDGNDNYRSCLTITRTADEWLVSYGPFTADIPDAPSTHNRDLLSALEWLVNWLFIHHNKWIVGKAAKQG